MGFLEEIQEFARRQVTGDNWYVKYDRLYVLELRAPATAAFIAPTVSYVVLPLGLQDYNVVRTYRQSVTPTVGGLVTEERGELWKTISIRWDPGLKPKKSVDTSFLPDFYMPGVALSGPAWSRRVLRNYFDNYAKLKSDPQFASETYMIWHDLKLDDHFVVVPSQTTLSRTTGTRIKYPLQMEFTSIGPADGIVLPPEPSNIFTQVQNVVSNVNKGLSLVSSAIQEGSAILGEINIFASQLGTVITNMQIIVNSAQDFVDAKDDVMSIGRDFVKSTAALLEDIMGAFEDESKLPDSVRQSLQNGLDGLHTIAAQRSAYGDTYQTRADRLEEAELGPAGRATDTELEEAAAGDPAQTVAEFGSANLSVSTKSLKDSGALDTPRAFTRYSAFTDYVVRATDSLMSIAAKQLGQAALWYDIAIINSLKPPYISLAKIPDTAQPGDTIRIPQLAGGTVTDRLDNSDSAYFTDMEWVETGQSEPGRPRVTLAVDRRTLKDVKTITGIDNLGQALQMRIWTERGSIPIAKNYGLRRVIGLGISGAGLELIRLSARETLQDDPRVRVVKRVVLATVEGQPDALDLDVDVIPIGETETLAVRSVVV